jgi:hypothetical protein
MDLARITGSAEARLIRYESWITTGRKSFRATASLKLSASWGAGGDARHILGEAEKIWKQFAPRSTAFNAADTGFGELEV